MAWRPSINGPSLPWSYIRPYRVEEVTSVNADAEVDPRSVGLSPAIVSEIWASVERLYKTRLHPAIGVCIRRNGKVVIDRAIGHASGNGPADGASAQKVPATPETLFNIYSASKAVTAMLVHLLDERGLLHLDDPVAEYIPEFAKNGKEDITIRHVLTHRAGIPIVPAEHADIQLLSDGKRIVELLCEARPTWPAGRRLGYHALTGGFVLAEIIHRVTGKDVRQLLRSEVTGPLGFDRFSYGVPAEDVRKVARNAFTGPPAFPPYSWLLERALGVTIREAVELSSHDLFLTSIIPSGNIVATSNETSRFFELLLRFGELDGVRVFDPRTVRRAIAETSFLEFDSVIILPVRYGMGFMLGSRWLSLYGHDTPNAFGHLGFTSVVAYADVDRDISVAINTSGKPFIAPGQLTWLQVARTIARLVPKTAR